MTLNRTISLWAALAATALAAGAVLGQEPLPDAAPPAFTPSDFTSLDDAPLILTTPVPLSSSFDGAPPDIPSPPPPRKENLTGSEVEGFGLGARGMGGLGMGGPGYGGAWYPSRPISGAASGTDFGLLRQRLSGALPVWRDGGDVVMLSGSVRNSLFFTDAILPESGRPFPNELWNVSLGTNYLHKFDNGWSGMLGVNFGSASDKPFHSIREMNVGFLSFLQVPVWNERDAWRFFLMYSPVGNLNFPIPGVAYQWNPSDTLRVSLGIPFSVLWRPVEDLTLNLSYMPLTTVNARATYRLVGKVFLYGGFESLQEAYLLADRENISDRFMGFEKRLIAGVRWDAWRRVALEVNAGEAFDRYYGVGQNQIGNLHDQVNIAAGAFVSTNLQIGF